MTKAEFIERYGEAAYELKLEKQREKLRKEEYIKQHGEEAWKKRLEKRREIRKRAGAYERELIRNREWPLRNPEKKKAQNNEQSRKGGKAYDKKLEYQTNGIPGERHKIRCRDGQQWKLYKDIIAPDSQIHHEWVPKTAEYTGLALVEKDQHMHGYVDVIEILDGKTTLVTEEDVKNGKKNEDEKEVETTVLLQ